MATVELRIHSDLTEDARPFEEALQFFADAAEGYFAYKMGDQDLNKQNYLAMLWVSNHLSGLIAQVGPVCEFEQRQEQHIEKKGLMHRCPYPPHTPYSEE
tara:strand:+ start:80 stop:379 length:300 start_codon:yes stop_codon:yes gene_type:complete